MPEAYSFNDNASLTLFLFLAWPPRPPDRIHKVRHRAMSLMESL